MFADRSFSFDSSLSRLTKLALGIAFTAALVGCGGGGDDDQAQGPHNFAGSYNLSLNKTTDNCGTGVQQSVNTTLYVEQNGRSIKIVGGGQTLNGAVNDSNDSFTASFTQTSNNIPVVVTLSYRTTGTKDVYSAVWDTVASSQGVTCRITYSGEARRQ